MNKQEIFERSQSRTRAFTGTACKPGRRVEKYYQLNRDGTVLPYR